MSSLTRISALLQVLNGARDQIADRIADQLLGAAFKGRPVDDRQASVLAVEAQLLLAGAHALAH